jgi:ribosomal protein L10
VHSALKISDFKQCLFGEHLLKNNTKTIAIVESEKTAVIASAYLPQFIWLAAGSKDGLNAEKCSVLKGRTVVLFPDLDGFEKWSSKANELSHIAKFTVSNLLNSKATEAERKQQFDIADYLVKFDLEAFTKPKAEQLTPPPSVQEVSILPTKEDLQYSKMANRNPHVEMLVSKLGLVSATTGKPLIKVPANELEKFEQPN